MIDECLVSVPGDARELEFGAGIHVVRFRLVELIVCLCQRGAGLRHLLVQFGCFDLRQQLVLGHAIADIDIALLHIPCGARVDIRLGQR